MNVIALPGRNQQTEVWLRLVLSESALPADRILRYRHWDSAVEADADYEAQRLSGIAPALLIAKSLGTVVAARAFCRFHFRPQEAILIGTPYSAVDRSDALCLRQLAEGAKTLFIQQAEDPGGSASQLAAALRLAVSDVVSVPGNDHLYTDIPALATIIQEWKRKAP